MRIVLFCENKYAIDILYPIYQEALKSEDNQLLWYIHLPKIPVFPLQKEVTYTHSIQEVYDFSPEAIFVPGNIVPYYLPGVKVQVFHGYAAEKKDHWVIRRYFDTYFTQGPFFTKKFKELAVKYGDFEVVETGWSKQVSGRREVLFGISAQEKVGEAKLQTVNFNLKLTETLLPSHIGNARQTKISERPKFG